MDVIAECDLSSRKRWRHAEVVTNHFWKCWLPVYGGEREVLNLAILLGVVEENSLRNRRPFGRITRVALGDLVVRE